jgi:hypothetical protein
MKMMETARPENVTPEVAGFLAVLEGAAAEDASANWLLCNESAVC